MTQQTSTLVPAPVGGVKQKVKRSHINNLVNDVKTLFRFFQGPTTGAVEIALKARLIYSAAYETVGTFTSDGKVYLDGTHEYHEAAALLGTETPVDGTTSSTVANTLVYNKAWLVPITGATTLKKLTARLSVGVSTNSANAGQANLDKVEVLVVKVAADGTETALDTLTKASIGFSNSAGSGYAPGNVKVISLSEDFGAGYALSATERLGIRIKLYGHSTSTSTTGLALNATGGTNGAPTSNLSAESWIALTFAE